MDQSSIGPIAQVGWARVIPHRLRRPLELFAEPHFRTPVVVFQSDDWGQPCARSLPELAEIWPAAASETAPSWMHDAQERGEDMLALAEVLRKRTDSAGRPPRFTLNFIVHVPDYASIRAQGFKRYAARPHASREAIRTAMACSDVFECALHGGEHLAPSLWLEGLRNQVPWLRRFFDAECMPPPGLISTIAGLGAPYLLRDGGEAETQDRDQRLRSALQSFKQIFGCASVGFVAPNHAWDNSVENVLIECGVQYLQACHVHYPSWDHVLQHRWLRQRAGPSPHSALCYQTRTLDFEPTLRPNSIDAAIASACQLLGRGISVVVNTHRINYVAALFPHRAEAALAALARLLAAMLKTRPDLRFADSAALAQLLRDPSQSGNDRLLALPIVNLIQDLARCLRPTAANGCIP